jgi:hypothetical protein
MNFGNFLDRSGFALFFNAIFSRHIWHLYFPASPPPIEFIRGSGAPLQGRTSPTRCRHGRGPGRDAIPETRTMFDLLFVALTVGFFAASVAYVHACDRL